MKVRKYLAIIVITLLIIGLLNPMGDENVETQGVIENNKSYFVDQIDVSYPDYDIIDLNEGSLLFTKKGDYEYGDRVKLVKIE